MRFGCVAMSGQDNEILQIARTALDLLHDYGQDLEKAANLAAPEAHRPNDLEFMIWWATQTQKAYPPEPWLSPEGLPVFGSAFELVLPYWEGGREELARWQRIVARTLGVAA